MQSGDHSLESPRIMQGLLATTLNPKPIDGLNAPVFTLKCQCLKLQGILNFEDPIAEDHAIPGPQELA